ncbi:MAG TPA: LytTR family DNA-binding domain-containing protein [Flavobacteriales bacterium]|nr:LytTR family DNA-binding domain-containing protein [Flavobacteriales bacterium]
MLRVAIVDDEAPARASLRAALGGLSLPVEVVGEAHDVPSAIALIDQAQPDVVLLDIWLGTGTGFDVLEGVTYRGTRVVFVTAYDQYAVRAFNSGAVHYLLKPVVRKDLEVALERASAAAPGSVQEVEQLRRSVLDRITVPTAEGFHVIDPMEIVRCESDGNYTRLFLADEERVLASRTLKEFEELLGPHGFMRVHLSHLVNMAQVRRYLHRDGGMLVLGNGTEVPVSHRRRQAVIASLGKRPGEES